MMRQAEPPKRRMLDEVRGLMRVQHYSIRTEQTYVQWIARFIRHHGLTSREQLTEQPEAKIETFLTHLAVDGKVSPSTQNQAMNVGTVGVTIKM